MAIKGVTFVTSAFLWKWTAYRGNSAVGELGKECYVLKTDEYVKRAH